MNHKETRWQLVVGCDWHGISSALGAVSSTTSPPPHLSSNSSDEPPGLLAWTNASRRDGGLGNINIPLLSDKNHQLSKDYGVLIEEEGIALRGLFIIDPNGIVRQITINDLPVGRSVDETLRLIDAFQFTDKYGEVCPANWNPGDQTIKATPEGNKEFAAKAYADKMDTNGTK